MKLVNSKCAYVTAIVTVAMNLILFIVAIAVNWQCLDIDAGAKGMSVCSKLYGDFYVKDGGGDDSFLNSGEADGEDKNAFKAALAFTILAMLATLAQLFLLFAKLTWPKGDAGGVPMPHACCSHKAWRLVYFILALMATIFSMMMWILFVGYANSSIEGRDLNFGPGFIMGVIGSVFSLYPLVYASAAYFGTDGMEGGFPEIAKKAVPPSWKYSAVRRSVLAP